MGFILRLLLTAVAVFAGAYLVPGVDVKNFWTAIVVAIVMGLLNLIVKPILVILTLPITILTLGLFYLVINVVIIYLTEYFVTGFTVDGFIPALLFSLLVAIINAVLGGLVDRD